MRYAFPGGANVFKEFAERLGKSGEEKWQLRGGHRIWAAPEDAVKTYAPDNGPVHVAIKGAVLEATEPVEPLTGLEKQITVKMSRHGQRRRGTAPHPQHHEEIHGSRSLGAFHDGAGRRGHPRISAARHASRSAGADQSAGHVGLHRSHRQALAVHEEIPDPAPGPEQPRPAAKARVVSTRTPGSAYLLGSDLFIKRIEADPKRTYPDLGASFETFTNADFLEQETLGPMTKLAPGASRRAHRAMDVAQERPHPRMERCGAGPRAAAAGSEVSLENG